MKPVFWLGSSIVAVLVFALLGPGAANSVRASSTPPVSLNVAQAGPREVEDTTQKSVARDYAVAWQAMADALDQNRADLLGASFIGTADEEVAAGIAAQRRNGLHQRIVDKGHKVDVVFYSPEGSAMELHDTARLEIQVLDGSKLIHSEDVTLHYVTLLTAAENSWKVRAMETVPEF